MSNRPWMPLYVNDYLADTRHLRTVDHGAYLLLIMHYWRTGGLPNDDRQLARITGLPLKTWTKKVRPHIESMFRPGWKHKRIDRELERYEVIRIKRSMAGHKGGTAYHKADNFLTTKSRKYQSTNSLKSLDVNEANAKQMNSNHSHIRKKEAAEEEKAGEHSTSELEAIIKSKGWN